MKDTILSPATTGLDVLIMIDSGVLGDITDPEVRERLLKLLDERDSL